MRKPVEMEVNGESVHELIEPRLSLADFLREDLNLTGTHVGCEQGVCGACTVLVDGKSVRSCLTLAVQVNGRKVETVESLGRVDELSELQAAFREHHALQCGFCTPGMLMTCVDLLRNHRLDTEADIREALSGNLCRCTGYSHIVRALVTLAEQRNQRGQISLRDEPVHGD